jgi:DNA polymerase-3 subunit epsilon
MSFQWIGKSTDGSTVTLHRFHENQFQRVSYYSPEWEAVNPGVSRIGSVIDVETTGLHHDSSKIIEIGIRTFRFNRVTGELLEPLERYSAFEDPGEPLSEEIKNLTGLTDEMLKGQSIDWTLVDRMLSGSVIVIAHNASFDRPFVDRKSVVSREKIWGCSIKQLDWHSKGFTSQKLDVLSIYHGFFTDAHRALNDAEALLHLLSFRDSATSNPYLRELLEVARKPTVHVSATHSPFESKDHLRRRSYRWDAQNKVWWREVQKEHLDGEIRWLEETVYLGPFRGKTRELAPSDHFKSGQDA